MNQQRIPSAPASVLALAVITAMVSLMFTSAPPSAHAQTATSGPTFSGDVARIIYAHCTVCHRSGEIAPFPLVSYHDVATRANQIAEVTTSREMPPWKPERNFGTHADVRGLSAQDIAVLKQWADDGAPPGDLASAPPAPTFANGSQLGTPDLVLKMPQAYTHNGEDVYRCFVLPTGLLDDRDIAAIEFRPGNPAIVHHVLFFLDTSGAARARDAADPGPGYTSFGGPGFDAVGTFFPWAPGATPRLLPPGLSQKMYKHSDLVIQIHYAPVDHEETDQSTVNIFFAKPAPVMRPVMQFAMDPATLTNGPFLIPPYITKRFRAEYPVPYDVSVLAVAPHMHLLGREMKAYCVKPNGDTIPFVWIRDWDFHWQGGYTFKKLVMVPAGSLLVVESMYDNTTSNENNPNSPPKFVAWGESTLDEMMICYFFYTISLPGDENVVLDSGSSGDVETGAHHLDRLACVPNPVRSVAQLEFTLATSTPVTLTLHDVLGRPVATLVNATLERGTYSMSIGDGAKTAGLPNGTYIARLVSGSETKEEMILFQR